MADRISIRPRYHEPETAPADVAITIPQDPEAPPKPGIMSAIYEHRIAILIIVIVVIIIGLIAYMFWGDDQKPKPRPLAAILPAQPANPPAPAQPVNPPPAQPQPGDAPVSPNTQSQNPPTSTQLKSSVPPVNAQSLLDRARAALTAIGGGTVAPERPSDEKTEDEILALMEDDDENVEMIHEPPPVSQSQPEVPLPGQQVYAREATDVLEAGVTAAPVNLTTTAPTTTTEDVHCTAIVDGRRCKNKAKVNAKCGIHKNT